jgi:hypothetical protein
VVEARALEQPRRPRLLARAGPEDAHLPVDLLVGDARVVGDAAAGGFPQLLEDVARTRVRERVKVASGSETRGLKHIESRALISPRWIASMISTAVKPAWGISSGRIPHTRATCSRAAGSLMERCPGSEAANAAG